VKHVSSRWLTSLILSILLFAVSVIAEAQQLAKNPRIGFLSTGSPAVISDHIDAFRQGLSELGYVEGKTIVIEYRSERNPERLRTLVAERQIKRDETDARKARVRFSHDRYTNPDYPAAR
jgi:putative ABC transport system substrate-binding protein